MQTVNEKIDLLNVLYERSKTLLFQENYFELQQALKEMRDLAAVSIAENNTINVDNHEQIKPAPKWQEYSIKINNAIASVLSKEGDENTIAVEDFTDDENFEQFALALSVVAPCRILNKLFTENKDWLEYNHYLNNLIFHYATNKKQ